MAQVIFNPDIHAQLIDLGYAYEAIPAYFDDGDSENGPGPYGSPPYDEYTGPDEYICIDEKGHVVWREARDLELEAWFDEQQALAERMTYSR